MVTLPPACYVTREVRRRRLFFPRAHFSSLVLFSSNTRLNLACLMSIPIAAATSPIVPGRLVLASSIRHGITNCDEEISFFFTSVAFQELHLMKRWWQRLVVEDFIQEL